MLQFLEREIRGWQGLQVLDTACGNGELAQALEDCGARVTAMESDPTVLREADARSRQSGQLRRPYYYQAGLNDLPGEHQSYQMILCLNNACSALSNEDAYRDFMNRCAELLVPSGRLVLQLFNYDRILDFQDYQLDDIAVPDSGICIERSLVPNSEGGLTLQSRVQILREDGYELSRFRTQLFPVRRHQLTQLLKECGFKAVDFYSDEEANSWNADSKGTLLVAVRN